MTDKSHSHRKEWNITICNNLDGPREYCALWHRSDNTVSLSCRIWKIMQMNVCAKQKHTHRHIKLTYGYYQKGKGKGEGWIRGMRLVDQTTICKTDEQGCTV